MQQPRRRLTKRLSRMSDRPDDTEAVARKFQQFLISNGATIAPSEHIVDFDQLSTADKNVYIKIAEWVQTTFAPPPPEVLSSSTGRPKK